MHWPHGEKMSHTEVHSAVMGGSNLAAWRSQKSSLVCEISLFLSANTSLDVRHKHSKVGQNASVIVCQLAACELTCLEAQGIGSPF